MRLETGVAGLLRPVHVERGALCLRRAPESQGHVVPVRVHRALHVELEARVLHGDVRSAMKSKLN